MKYLGVIIFCLLAALYCSFNTNCRNNYKESGNDSLDVKICRENLKFNQNGYKNLFIVVKNVSHSEISIPEWLTQGFLSDNLAEVKFEVQKKTGYEGFKKVSHIDIDYDFFTFERENISLKPNETYKYGFELDLLYDLSISGEYKVKAIVKLPGLVL
jgi:hypothetical protein